jgi:AraC family transcriptional regulator of adaptative response / methylphosphotriester-DNA alkyltransferase methyltransferase
MVGTAAIEPDAAPTTRPATRHRRRAILDDALEILATEYAQPVKIEEVARRVATSPRQLQRAFAEAGGVGFRASLRRIRLSHAAELIAGTDLPVSHVARRVGYRDVSQFSKAFSREQGVSPSQLRRTVRAGSSPVSPARPGGRPVVVTPELVHQLVLGHPRTA